jgi:hypothetical protein
MVGAAAGTGLIEGKLRKWEAVAEQPWLKGVEGKLREREMVTEEREW